MKNSDILDHLEKWLEYQISQPLEQHNDSTYLFSSSYPKALSDVLYFIECLKLKNKD